MKETSFRFFFRKLWKSLPVLGILELSYQGLGILELSWQGLKSTAVSVRALSIIAEFSVCFNPIFSSKNEGSIYFLRFCWSIYLTAAIILMSPPFIFLYDSEFTDAPLLFEQDGFSVLIYLSNDKFWKCSSVTNECVPTTTSKSCTKFENFAFLDTSYFRVFGKCLTNFCSYNQMAHYHKTI